MSVDKKFKYHFYLNEKEFYEKTFSLEEIENGEFLNFKNR